MESSPSTISPSSSNSTSHNLMQLDAYMSSLFDYEIETIEPIEKQIKKEQEQTEPLNFNLYGHIIQPISLDNPYAYTVNNTRAYDYTLDEEREMKLKFDSISVGLTDVLQMANREQQKSFVKRLIEVKFVPLKMKRKRNKRKSKEEVDRLELIKKEGRETEKNVDKKRKQRPSKKKRIIERKIKAGNLVDFRIKIKSKEWKNWVGK